MARTNDSCKNDSTRSASPNEFEPKQQQEPESSFRETSNTVGLCPQCSFASRSPSEVDEHMINVHKVTVRSEWDQEESKITTKFPNPLNSRTMNPSLIDSSVPITRNLSDAMSATLPMMPVFQNGVRVNRESSNESTREDESADGANKTVATTQSECTPCSSQSLMPNITLQSDSRRRYKCSRCPSSFPWHGDLTDHMKEIHGVKKNSRNSSRGGNAANGNNDVDSTKCGRSAGTYSCPFCKYVAKYLSELRRHMRLHMGVKPFACIFCPYKSAWKGDLKRHMESHHRDKFQTDEDLAHIMARFKNNAGTTSIEAGQEPATRSSSTSPNHLTTPQTSNETPSMVPGPPSTTHTDLSVSTPTTGPSDLLFNSLPLFPSTSTKSIKSRLHPSLESLVSILKPSTVSPQPSTSLLSSPPSLPPQELLLTTPPPFKLLPPLNTMTPPGTIESLNSLLSNCEWLRIFQNLTPEQIKDRTDSSPDKEEPQQLQPQSSGSTDEPLNLVCRPDFLTNSPFIDQASPSQTHPPPPKRRSLNPSGCNGSPGNREEQWKRYKCSSCGHRSNWKWDINKHIKVAHPEREDVTTITMELDMAKQTLQAYLERVRTYGRNGRPSVSGSNDDANPSCSNILGSCQQDREGYIRPYMCPFCGHRSNWKWDVRKHMKQMHGHEAEVITLSNEEARRTIDQYKSNRRQSQSLIPRCPTTDTLNEPSISRQCCASETSRDTIASADENTIDAASDDSTQPGGVEAKSSSAFRCNICKMTFQMWKSLAQHVAFHHPSIGKAATAAATAVGNIVASTNNASTSSGSSPLELRPVNRVSLRRRSLSPPSFDKLSPWNNEKSTKGIKPAAMQHLPCIKTPLSEPIPSTSVSPPLASFQPEPASEGPRLSARRSLMMPVASSSTQTQNPLQLSTLDNLLFEDATNSFSTTVFQFAEMLRQVVNFLQSLLNEENKEINENSNIQQISKNAEQLPFRLVRDENEPSASADRSQRLAWLLLQPQVQSLADRLLPLIHRVKQRLNISDVPELSNPSQFPQ